MSDTPTPAEIARRLSPAQRRAVPMLEWPGFRALRPGHNLNGEVSFDNPDMPDAFDGDDLEMLHRLGLATAVPAKEPLMVRGGPHAEAGEVVATHRYVLSDLGIQVRAALLAMEGGDHA